MMRKNNLPEILPEPSKPESVPADARWLSGEGAGSWFAIFCLTSKDEFEAIRYSPEGNIECQGVFIQAHHENGFYPGNFFELDYPSNCKVITVIQQGKKITLINRRGIPADENYGR